VVQPPVLVAPASAFGLLDDDPMPRALPGSPPPSLHDTLPPPPATLPVAATSALAAEPPAEPGVWPAPSTDPQRQAATARALAQAVPSLAERPAVPPPAATPPTWAVPPHGTVLPSVPAQQANTTALPGDMAAALADAQWGANATVSAAVAATATTATPAAAATTTTAYPPPEPGAAAPPAPAPSAGASRLRARLTGQGPATLV
jgi:hypothetical protein